MMLRWIWLVPEVLHRGAAPALVAERGHRHPPPVVETADDVEQRRPAAVDVLLAEAGATRRLAQRPDGDAVVLHRRQHERQPPVLGRVGVGAAPDDAPLAS